MNPRTEAWSNKISTSLAISPSYRQEQSAMPPMGTLRPVAVPGSRGLWQRPLQRRRQHLQCLDGTWGHRLNHFTVEICEIEPGKDRKYGNRWGKLAPQWQFYSACWFSICRQSQATQVGSILAGTPATGPWPKNLDWAQNQTFEIWIWFDHLRWEWRGLLQLMLTRMEPEHVPTIRWVGWSWKFCWVCCRHSRLCHVWLLDCRLFCSIFLQFLPLPKIFSLHRLTIIS